MRERIHFHSLSSYLRRCAVIAHNLMQVYSVSSVISLVEEKGYSSFHSFVKYLGAVLPELFEK